MKKTFSMSDVGASTMWRISRVLLLTLLILSCATKAGFQEIDDAVTNFDFKGAIVAIDKGEEGKKPNYGEKNQISLILDKGFLEYYARDYTSSSEHLLDAERLITEAFTKSRSQSFAAAFLGNDNNKDYAGEDFEDVYLSIFNALNFYNKGSLDSALVEIRKLSESSGKLEMLQRKYEFADPEGKSLGDRIIENIPGFSGSMPEIPSSEAINFSNSALARYLGVLFFLADRNEDSARIEYEMLKDAFNNNKNIYYNPIPSAVDELYTSESTRLNVLSFSGYSPWKVEEEVPVSFVMILPELRDGILKLPKLVDRESNISRIEVIVEGGDTFTLELLEDMGAVVGETFKAKASDIHRKAFIRTFIGYALADITAAVSIQQGAPELAIRLTALGAKKIIDAVGGADIRMGRFLPDYAWVGGIEIDPGTYDITVNYYHGHDLVHADSVKGFEVKSGSPNLLQSAVLR